MSYGLEIRRGDGTPMLRVVDRTFWIVSTHVVTMSNLNGTTTTISVNGNFLDGTWGFLWSGVVIQFLEATMTSGGLQIVGKAASRDAQSLTFDVVIFRL